MNYDFIPPADNLAQHAEWLLQSARTGGQVEPGILAEALAYEHGEWLRRLGAAVSAGGSDGAGSIAAGDTLSGIPAAPPRTQRGALSPPDELLVAVLAAALTEAHAYDSSAGTRPWLASLAIKTILASPSSQIYDPESFKLNPASAPQLLNLYPAAALRLLCGFSRSEIRRIPGQAETALVWLPALSAAFHLAVGSTAADEGEPRLVKQETPAAGEQEDGQIVYPWSRSGKRPAVELHAAVTDLSLQEQRLAEALQQACPAPPPLAPDRLNALAARATRRAGKRSVTRRRRIAVNEIALVGLAILVVMLVIWGADRLLPPETDAPRTTLPPATPILYNAGALQPSLPTATSVWRDHVAYVVQPGDTLETVSKASGVAVDEIKRTNGLTESEPIYTGQPLWVNIPDFYDSDPADLATWISPPVRSSPAPPALPNNASPGDILERIRLSRNLWGSLWADYQLVYYGPERYVSPPRAYRFQVWVVQPGHSLEIFNELSSLPDMRHITLNGRSYTSAMRYAGAYLDPDWNHPPEVLLTNPLLREIIFPGESQRFSATVRIKPEGVMAIAGRSALIVNLSSLSSSQLQLKLWIDRRLGIILRRQTFEDDTGKVMSDMIATRIILDADFPAALFNPVQPWQGGFANGPDGYADPLDSLPPTPTWALPTTR